MAKYRKKLVEIEAIQFKRDCFEKIKEFTNSKAFNFRTERCLNGKSCCDIETLEGIHIATEGDYIIKGVKGEFYPCKSDIFEMTYEEVRKDCGSGNNKKLNKILIRCDGEDIIIDTIRKVSEISRLIKFNLDEQLIVLNDMLLEDEGFKDEIAINPRAVTLIKEVTEDESIIPLENSIGIDKLATEVIKRINENNKNKKNILNIGSEEIGRVAVDKFIKTNQVLGN